MTTTKDKKKEAIKEVAEAFKEVTEGDDNIDNKLEMMKYTTKIQSSLSKSVSTDFILAKLGKEDKEGIVNMVANAYMCKRLLYSKLENYYTYKWDDDAQRWRKVILKRDDAKNYNVLKGKADSIFDTIMVKVNMTAVLNRNVPKNHLLRMVNGLEEDYMNDNDDDFKDKVEKKLEGKKEEK